jgi:hypothetical protein
MTWAERLRASWNGDVAGGDVRALLAASGSLDLLREQLADRRLSAQIDHIGEEWHIPATLAPLALPLWLGDSLVTLARGLCDAEADAHPDRPNSLSAASHDLAVAALRPIDTIVAEALASAADVSRPPWLTAVVMVGPRGEVASLSLPAPIPPGYINGLLTAGERLHGAAGLLLSELTTLLQPSSPPAWLKTGIQHVKGNLAASGARLAMLRTRLNMLLPDPQHVPPGLGHDTLAPLCHELWEVLNAALVGGQLLSDPRLMPGAHATPPRPAPAAPSPPPHPTAAAPRPVAPSPVVAAARPPAPPPTPRPPTRAERARDLPDIQTLPIAGPRDRQPSYDPAHRESPRPASEPQPLPDIGGEAPPAGPVPGKAARPLPSIEGPAHRDGQEVRELPKIGPE